MNKRYALVDPNGWHAFFDLKRGPMLAKNPNLIYLWDTPEQAEAQRYLYEHALKVKLEVKEYQS